MSVYKRGGSPYYHYDFTFRGTRYRGCTKETTADLARIVEGDLMTQLRQGHKDALLGRSPRLEEFAKEFNEWVDNTNSLEPGTKRYYKNGWRLLKGTVLAKQRMDEITNHTCETLKFPGCGTTANAALRTLRRMFTKAREIGRIFNIPQISLRKEWGRSIAMSKADAAAIAAHMPEGDAKDAFLVLRETGMRPKECYSMRWEYMDWQRALYCNPKGKTKTSRRAVLLLGDSAVILGRRHMAQGSPAEGWVFPAKSECGHTVSINKAFSLARNKAGLPKAMVLYTGRHGAGTDLGAVLSLKEVMDVLGHSETRTAMRYQHPATADVQARLEAAKTNGRIM